MNICRSGWIGLAVLLCFGCDGSSVPPMTLSAEDEAAARGWLRAHFTAIHDHEFEPPAELDAQVERALAALAAQLESVPGLSVLWLNNPDADAGCIAGGQLFLTIGLLAFVEHPDELAGALALALTACGEANDDWRRRASSELPELDRQDPLMIAYRDLRLNEQASLYRQLVRPGCGGGRDCHSQAHVWLTGAGIDPAGLDRLLARVGENWPDAAVIYRFDGYPESPGGTGADNDFLALVAPYKAMREILGHLRDARWELLTGDLREAYRANLRARRIDSESWLPLIMQARLDLENFHPEYTQRELRGLREVYTDGPSLDLYQGIARWQQHHVDEAVPYLEASIEARPTVSGHYHLGRIFALRNEREQAMMHFRIALQGGEIHPYGRDAATRLAALENGQSTKP